VVRSDGREGASLDREGSRWLPQEERLAVRIGSDVAIFSPFSQWKSPDTVWKNAGIGPFSPDGQQYAAERVHQRPVGANGLNQDRAEL
jgi:hypothetical protein